MSTANAPLEYIQLAFMIDRHLPDYVDSYFGPPDLQARAADGEPEDLAELEERANSLENSISSDSNLTPDRRNFLLEELGAMRTTIQILKGDAPDIIDEVRRLYGVEPSWVDESVFEDAHTRLNEILPGSAPLAERVQEFRKRSRVPAEVAVPIMHDLLEDFRGRTRRLFDLAPDEQCEIVAVSDQPWRAYNWYLGKGRSRIELNLDLPLEMWDIPNTLAHEAYPGHHTKLALKENRLYLQAGCLEQSIRLSNTPSALISEGIAKNALNAIASEEEITEILVTCYERAGLLGRDAKIALAFAEASLQLESVTDNQVLMRFQHHAPDKEVIDYGMRYALTTLEDENHLLRFLDDSLSRSYTYNYTLGHKLVADFLARSADPRRAFQRLLTEPVTPGQLAN